MIPAENRPGESRTGNGGFTGVNDIEKAECFVTYFSNPYSGMICFLPDRREGRTSVRFMMPGQRTVKMDWENRNETEVYGSEEDQIDLVIGEKRL